MTATTNKTTITLPPARADQLRLLAEGNGCTLSEVIELLLNGEIAAGRLPDALPGFPVSVIDGRVRIEFEGIGLPLLASADARRVAGMFQRGADSTPEGFGNRIEIEGRTLAVGRKGRGIVGRVGGGGLDHKFSMTPGMARDLARQIKKVAD